MQVLGGVLFCLGAMTILLARTIGFEVDVFYLVMCIFGACLFLYGAIQRKRNVLTSQPQRLCGYCTEEPDATDGVQANRTDFTACANSASLPASMRQRVAVHGD